jgi:arsenate reductase (thioredoxin)
MKVSELAELAGVAPSAVRWYESAGVLPPATRQANGYREYADGDLARLRLVVTLRRLGVGPDEAGRIARLCLDDAEMDRDLAPLIAEQRAAIARERDDLDRLDDELIDLESTIAAAGHARGRGQARPRPGTPIRVLFVCTGNSARSQMAEAILRRLGGADFEVISAGTAPKGVNPYTIQVLADVGIDWSGATSKSAERFAAEHFDYVITVCDRARQSCPVFAGPHNTLHWGLEDPAEFDGTDAERLGAFQQTYRELQQRIRPFVEVALRAAGRTRSPSIVG